MIRSNVPQECPAIGFGITRLKDAFEKEMEKRTPGRGPRCRSSIRLARRARATADRKVTGPNFDNGLRERIDVISFRREVDRCAWTVPLMVGRFLRARRDRGLH